jgi:hypothetical protein
VTVRYDFIKLSETSRKEIEDKYSEYFVKPAENPGDWILHKVNYNDFLFQDNDFLELVNSKLKKLEDQIIGHIQEFIEEEKNSISDKKHLVSESVYSRIRTAYIFLLNAFNSEGELALSFYLSNKTVFIPELTEIMDLVVDRMDMFKNRIIKDFRFYFEDHPDTIALINSFKKIDKSFKEKKNNIPDPKNYFPRIFTTAKGYSFFLSLKEEICTEQRTKLADYSFVFRKLMEDKFLYEGLSEREFRDFILSEYEVDLPKLKTFQNYNQNNLRSYNRLKLSIVPR